MRSNRLRPLNGLLLLLASGCELSQQTVTVVNSGGKVDSQTPSPSPSPSLSPSPTPQGANGHNNVMPISVNGALCSANSYPNKPCVSVTICTPGTTTCVTVTD